MPPVIERTIRGMTADPREDWVNDVVLVYYQGQDIHGGGEHWLLTSRNLQFPKAPPQKFAIPWHSMPRLPGTELLVLNVLDKRYVTGGYFDYDDAGNYVPLLIPAATRSILAGLEMEW